MESADLPRLERLRARFLDADPLAGGVDDYWTDEEDLEAYDAVFAQRIAWKWDAVLEELAERGFDRADDALIVDWGCGTGVAARRFVARFGARAVRCSDRSPLAVAFAVRRLRQARPGLDVAPLASGSEPDVLLISHVLNELDAGTEARLLELVERSRRVVWVEPGTQAVSRRLSMLRDMLRERFSVVAPCTHGRACGALADAAGQDWCHFFAPPPREVFQDGDWVRLSKRLGVDLRALPYAFMALDRDPTPSPAPAARLVGRPRIGRHEARIHACDAAGLRPLRVEKRRASELFRTLKKNPAGLRTARLALDGDRVVGWLDGGPIGS